MNCFSARRQLMEIQPQLFHSQELTAGHTATVYALECSTDGTLMISGGRDRTVRLWSLNQGRGGWNPTEMETKHDEPIRCLAFSPDNNRIFSGGLGKKAFIDDAQT